MAGNLTASSWVRSRWFAVVLATVSTLLTAFGLVYFYFIYPNLRAGIRQPIPFSHRLHAGVKEIDCRFCHPYVARNYYAGLPPADKCLFCHKYIIVEHPYIRELRDYAERHEPVAWRKVIWLPDHVQFDHQPHILKDVQCVECHGQVETMDRLWDPHPKIMGFCVDCHRLKNASMDCWACHK